jgi:hypothetical protein
MQPTLSRDAPFSSLAALADADLLATVSRLAQQERTSTTALVAALAELDARRLYLGEGCSSLFVYCTRVLRLSEHAAYHRIEAARAAQRFPVILERLARGSLTLTTVTLLAPRLTPDNHQTLLEAAHHKSKREVEQQVAALAPRPDVPTSLRKFPNPRPRTSGPSAAASPATSSCGDSVPTVPADLLAPSHANDSPAAGPMARATGAGTVRNTVASESTRSVDAAAPDARRALPVRERYAMTPLAPGRYKLQMTLCAGTVEKLRRARDLLRHTIPDGDPAAIVDRALTLLLDQIARTKLAATDRPRPARPPSPARSRHVPAAVRRAVWARDGGRCTFVGAQGRCGETGFLELHHRVPYALGGATTIEGMTLRCRAHNAYEAQREFKVLELDMRNPRARCEPGSAASS